MPDQTPPSPRWQVLLEIVLVFAVFFLHGAYPVPDSNEAHYLAKAKHYWDTDWAAGDFFLESADAHQVFYWAFGWVTLWFSLPQAAWLGRIVTWLLLAIGWQRLSHAAVPRQWLSVLTAAVFVGLNENAHMAGEWVIGGIEAKGFAYAIVFFALAQLARSNWRAALILMGAAAAFHVLVGGWALVGAAGSWLMFGAERPRLKVILPAALIAAALALPAVYFGLSLTQSADSETIAEANRIYVFERLPHHLVAAKFAPGFLTRHLLLQALWFLWLSFTRATSSGQRALRGFISATIVVAGIGLALELVFGNQKMWVASLMRYYWFRSSDAFVPGGVAIALAELITGTLVSARVARAWLIGSVTLATVDSFHQIEHLPFTLPVLHPIAATPRADKNVEYDDWRDACVWIAEHTAPSDVILTPRSAATLKWYTGRPEVATWKDVPQDATSIVEWWNRMNTLHGTGQSDDKWFRSFSELGVQRLRDAMDKYGATYVIVPLRPDLQPLEIKPLYSNASFAIYGRPQLAGL
jgi:hypothetical protein